MKKLPQIILYPALVLTGLLAALVAVLAFNTFQNQSRQVSVAPAALLQLDMNAAAERLGAALRFKTISGGADTKNSPGEFLKLHAYLAQTYPKVHSVLKRELVNDLSLLYTWEGTDPKAKPILLMAHQDVVPAEATEWAVEPFSGVVQNGFIWGRGAWDNKSSITGHMEAVELLLSQGFRPRQTIYLAYGHDEEVHGSAGAMQIAKLMQSRGIKLDFVLDEGLVVADGILKGLSRPAALIGLAEKGYLSVALRVPCTAGHSLMPPPPRSSAIAMMAAALQRLDDNQLPGKLRGVAYEMFEPLAPEMQGFNRIALSNLWLFSPLVQAQLEKGAATNAMVRTTTALTMVKSGIKDNVMPGSAEATVNFRLYPGDTHEHVMAHVEHTLDNRRFEVKALPGHSEASPVSPTTSTSWRLLSRTVRAAFPDALVAPGLVMGGTDSRHFVDLSDHIYRFSPVRVRPDDIGRIHGTDERLAVKNYEEMITFYFELLRNAGRTEP